MKGGIIKTNLRRTIILQRWKVWWKTFLTCLFHNDEDDSFLLGFIITKINISPNKKTHPPGSNYTVEMFIISGINIDRKRGDKSFTSDVEYQVPPKESRLVLLRCKSDRFSSSSSLHPCEKENSQVDVQRA